MLRIDSTQSYLNEIVALTISVDEGPSIAAIEFDLHYDPLALEPMDFQPTTGHMAASNLNDPGIFRFITLNLAGLPVVLGTIFFKVLGRSNFVFQEVKAGESDGTPMVIAPQVDASVEQIGGSMNLEFTFPEYQVGVPLPQSADGIRVFESDGVDPATSNVVAVGDIPGALVGTFAVSSNRGDRWYFGAYYNEGGAGGAGPVAIFNTNVPPTEVPGAPTIQVVP